MIITVLLHYCSSAKKVFPLLVLFCIIGQAKAQTNLATETNEIQTVIKTENTIIQTTPYQSTSYQIADTVYHIKGKTKRYALSLAVPIDTETIFQSKEQLEEYLKTLHQKLRNVRAIETVDIQPSYGSADAETPIPVNLDIYTVDTWNFIAIPYPSFDSNSGFRFKIKLQDFNFAGSLQPIKADIVYQLDESNNSILSSGVRFKYPFKAGIFDMNANTDFDITYKHQSPPKIELSTGLEAAYNFNKHFTLCFGLKQGVVFNTSEHKLDKQYHLNTKFYLSLPIYIASVRHFGKLKWIPYMDIAGKWGFNTAHTKQLKDCTFHFKHTLQLAEINWISNFKKGTTFSFENSYSYNIYEKHKVDTSFNVSAGGYFPFINKVALYGRTQFFYNLHRVTTDKPGVFLRGILNNRLETDTGFMFNFDIPIRIASLDFQDITGVSWTRFFNCDIQFSPFFDFAWVHDIKTDRYYNPKDGWYAGGVEVIVFPQKMRSINVRASVGFDLSELKNVPGLNKLQGTAKRDGKRITEIFIGLGLHY